jgi:hypothetical protein
VRSDYSTFYKWTAVQGISAAISSVLATQSLLNTVGIGNTVTISVGASVSWILKGNRGTLSFL